ncbi:ribosome silencing factor [Acetobacteraceae bacterium H6797]|nr:ribosome silencing factor [Acetobacteraceae bacterium H6797]
MKKAPSKKAPADVAPAIKLPAKPAARKAKTAAGPESSPAPRPRSKVAKPAIDVLTAAAVKSLEDDKAEDVVVIDVSTRSSFADRMVVATGLADRQIQAMAAHLDKALGEAGLKRLRVEASPDWVLVDAGDLIIHLFKPEARANYRLERMWGPESPVEDDTPAVLPGVIKVTPTGETDILAEIEAVADVKHRAARVKRLKPRVIEED